MTSYQVFLAVERFVAGAWDDAVAEFEAALEPVAETGERYSLVLGHSVMSLIALRRGDLQHAEAAAASAARELAAGGPRYRSHWATWPRALLLEAGGNVPDAFATLDGCWDLCARSGLAIEYPALGADLVRLALAAGEEGRAAQVAAAVAEVAARNDVPSLAGAASRCRGLVERDPTVLRSAVDAYAQGPRPLELALTAEEAGTGFARRGDAAAAAPLLHQALAAYERLDAAREAAGPRRPCASWGSAAAAGARAGDRSSAGRASPQPSTGWWTWSSKGSPTPRSASACSSRAARCRPTSPTCSPSLGSRHAPSWPPRRCGTARRPGTPSRHGIRQLADVSYARRRQAGWEEPETPTEEEP